MIAIGIQDKASFLTKKVEQDFHVLKSGDKKSFIKTKSLTEQEIFQFGYIKPFYKWYFYIKDVHLHSIRPSTNLYLVRWHKQKLNVVLQQERPLAQDKEMQQKKVLKVARGDVRINLFF